MDKFEKATGKNLEAWMEIIGQQGSLSDIPHKEMARIAEENGASAWWAQSIAVEVERKIGRRALGQTCTGDFNANASKTIPGEWTEVFEKFVAYMADTPEALPSPLQGESSSSATEKWRYWRANFSDGTRVNVVCNDGSAKGVAKTKLATQHDKLPDDDARDEMKTHWKSVLASFADSLK
ncbi:hypothetical protein QP027_11380 [Corynebacterium breve]|uniref:DUF4287 domain-containing protein n=1 Tax=Corynebacterium breve TaxID=3049799 RepID=A0ABY8VHH2_9CORY|nr:hypothetical protein [Corynebacterium breve]WIM67669.1 hypothetical protein QP027_11380 [Corynebacterium breve]